MSANARRMERMLALRQADYAAAKTTLAKLEFVAKLEFRRDPVATQKARQNLELTRDAVLAATNDLALAARGVAS